VYEFLSNFDNCSGFCRGNLYNDFDIYMIIIFIRSRKSYHVLVWTQ